MRTVTTLSLAALTLAQHDGHDHAEAGSGAVTWEWAGIFAVDGHDLSLNLFPDSTGAWPDPTMTMVFLPTTTVTEAGMHGMETEAEHGFEATCTEVEPCEVDANACTITPAEDACFMLHLEGAAATYTVRTAGMTGLTIFAQHGMGEFAGATHYLTEGAENIMPVATMMGDDAHDHGGGAEATNNTPVIIGVVIGCIVAAVALIGVIGYVNNKPKAAGAPDNGVVAAA